MKCDKCGNSVEVNSPFCGNCGEKINLPKQFCGQCGNEIENGGSFCGQCGNIIKSPEPVAKECSTNSAILSIKNKFVSLIPTIKKYKFIIGGITAVLILVLSIYFIYQNFYDFTKLSWEENYGNYKYTHIMGGNIKLKVNAFDKENNEIKNIKFEATSGEVAYEENIVTWSLPNKPGTYKITASSPSGKKIEKEIIVLENDIEKELNNGMIIPEGSDKDKEITTELDSDLDGLTDKEEEELKTNPYKADSDLDGLTDYYEINISKTDPLKADTDGDELLDGSELELKMDPLKADTKGDGIKDGDREFDYKTQKENITLNVNGTGNINTTTIDISTNRTFSNIEGFLPKVYDLNTKGKLKTATITIKYTDKELSENSLTEDNLSIYYFDIKTKKLEKVVTKIDKNSKTLTADLSHFSKYVIADSNKVNTSSETKVLFLIDDSVSMYSEEQMIELGYNNSVGAVGNDPEFKRLTLSNSLIDLFSNNYKVAVGEFSGEYELKIDFTNDKIKLKETINGIKNTIENATGTAIVNALTKGINNFETDENSNKYIVLMTDGKETKSSLKTSKNTIIDSAKNKGVKICVIGLGDVDSEALTDIANQTGCGFYHASNASALDEIYKNLGSVINYDLVDTDADGEVDSTITSDSGFIVTRDGFSFPNFSSLLSEGGNCYGMALFALGYYTNELPASLSDVDEWGFFFRGINWFNKKANGYNLKNTYFYNYSGNKKGQNLYDYNFETEALKIYFTRPDDYRNRIENKIYYINEVYYELLKSLGVSFSIKKYNGSNKEIKEYQNALLNTATNEFKQNTTTEEQNLLLAIYRLFILQIDDERTSFSTNPDKAYKLLEDKLNSNVPVILTVNGNHAINATKILKNNDDSNKFKIEVYDNNYPGEIRYIEATRNKMSTSIEITTWFNEYQYTFDYNNDNDISVSINEPIIQ